MNEIFDKILDEDEKIVKIYKPNKLKFNLSIILGSSCILIWFVLVSILAILIPDEGYSPDPIMVLLPIGGFVIIELLVLLFSSLYYKNLYYAYTNKRLIIRSGIFGVDFRSLDMGMIGAVDVYVSVLDRILNKNTGTICFGSTASPMMAVKGGSYYKFAQINAPYESCKEIKNAIDAFKNGKNADNKNMEKTNENLDNM